MRIKAERTEEVNISQETMRQVAIRYIYERYGIMESMYVDKDGQLLDEVEISAGSHSYWETQLVKEKATEEDRILTQAIKLLGRR